MKVVPVEMVTLGRPNGVQVKVLNTGASLYELRLPSRSGRIDNVVLNLPDLNDYATNPDYVGCIVGRFANRVQNARFKLDGLDYHLIDNDRGHALHGGPDHFGVRPWNILRTSADSITLGLTSQDGDQGFPGTLTVEATYRLTDDALVHTYEATTTSPTWVSLTNHAYFNLAGHGDILDHEIQILASRYTPVDSALIPTGVVATVAGTLADLRKPVPMRDAIRKRGTGFDDNYSVDGVGLRKAAVVREPESGRSIEMWTDQPGLQLYCGDAPSSHRSAFGPYPGLCLEPQLFPDAPNRPEFGQNPLRPGEIYRQRTEWRFGVTTD